MHLYLFLLLNVVAIIQDMYAHYCLINIWYIIFNRIVYNQRLSYSSLWEGFCTLVSTFVLVFHLVFHSVSINNMLIITSTGIQRKMKTLVSSLPMKVHFLLFCRIFRHPLFCTRNLTWNFSVILTWTLFLLLLTVILT